MSRVQIRQQHSKSDDEVRNILLGVEDDLASRFRLSTEWRGNDTVLFRRSGLQGELVMEPGCVVIKLKLGVMLGLIARQIQTELENSLSDKLG